MTAWGPAGILTRLGWMENSIGLCCTSLLSRRGQLLFIESERLKAGALTA